MDILKRQLALALSMVVYAEPSSATLIEDLANYWNSQAFLCTAADGTEFPSRPTGDAKQPCDDGDMTLFNGLLCASGDERGCRGVAAAQDLTTGEWFRSPRIRLAGNDRGGASFSPDMALGVQLYLIKKRDIVRAEKWLLWLHSHVACSIPGPFDTCILYALPRFCTDDVADKGCTMRPGDAAMLSATVSYMQSNMGLPPLPDGRLRGYLGTFSGLSASFEEISSQVNKPGYSQHLVGVSVLLHQMMGNADSKLSKATGTLRQKNPGNAFYTYLDKQPSEQINSEILARCPSPQSPPTPPLHQWQWERENADKAWEHSCFWDCIFMRNLSATY